MCLQVLFFVFSFVSLGATVRSLKRAKQSAEVDGINLKNFPENWWTVVEFFKFVWECISRLFGGHI